MKRIRLRNSLGHLVRKLVYYTICVCFGAPLHVVMTHLKLRTNSWGIYALAAGAIEKGFGNIEGEPSHLETLRNPAMKELKD